MTDSKIPILLFGAGGHGHSVIDTIEREGKYTILGIIDETRDVGTQAWGYPVLGGLAQFAQICEEQKCRSAFVALGDSHQRQHVTLKLRKAVPRLKLISIIHPTAIISSSVTIGEGVVVMAGAVVNAGVSLADGCLVNTRASIDHDCVIEEYASIAPGAILGGAVKVGARSLVGQGSTVIQKIRIGQDTIIGAGSVVVESQPDRIVSFGNPCRFRRRREPNDTQF